MKSLIDKERQRPSKDQLKLLQAAHDLRAPVSAIMAVLESSGEFCSTKRLLTRQALMRILHLAENILIEHRNAIPASENYPIISAIESLVEEKRALFPALKIEIFDESRGIQMSKEKLLQVQRVLCCIIQNSAEAMERQKDSLVRIFLKVRYSKFLIVVEDNGPGIVSHVREKLGSEPISYMKADGNGLGLLYSAQIIKSLGGQMKIHSRMNVGTRVTLVLKP